MSYSWCAETKGQHRALPLLVMRLTMGKTAHRGDLETYKNRASPAISCGQTRKTNQGCVSISALQTRNRDTDVENKCMDTKGGKQGCRGWWWDELGDWD